MTFGAAWSVLVLYSLDRLGMGEVGFGLLTSALACGGLAGTLVFGWLERRVSLGNIMRGGLIIETLTHLVLAVNTLPAVAMVVFFVFGAHAFIWGTISTTIRQRAVPAQMQGRVASLYMIGVTGGMVLGSVLGGLIASAVGHHRAVLVRLRRIRAVPGPDLAPARPRSRTPTRRSWSRKVRRGQPG